MSDVATIRITIRDDKNAKGTITLYADKAMQGIVMERAAQAIATKIYALIGGTLDSITYTIPCTLPDGLSAPDTNSDVEERAFFPLNYADGGSGGFSIPTFDEVFYFDHSTIVDGSYEQIDDLANMLTDGASVVQDALTAGTVVVTFTDRRNNAIVEFIAGHEHFLPGR